MEKKHRVLVVDDSAYMRKVISNILEQGQGFEVIATANNGVDACAKAASLKPDVITMDVEMPLLNGIEATRKIMASQPTPIVMLSSLTQAGATATLEALSAGAVDFIAKPSGPISLDLPLLTDEIRQKVRIASRSRPRVSGAYAATAQGKPVMPLAPSRGRRRFVVIAASTGGPGALVEVFAKTGRLPVPVLVVQHMPKGFTQSLAQRLNDCSQMTVREASEGEPVEEGVAYVAPGGFHMLIGKDQRIVLSGGPPVHGVRPAADPLFESVVAVAGSHVVGVVLTGMGFDGARGMARIKQQGGRTITEDESTCVVYGMPRAVVEMGNSDASVPIHDVAGAIRQALGM